MNQNGDMLDFGSSREKTLEGALERVTYHSAETGYTVARVKIAGRAEPVTVVGRLADPTPGQYLQMEGEWTRHPKYGLQFQIERSRTAVPATATGIEKYLASGLVKGIGPVMASRLVARFGEDTLEVIENDPGRLAEVEGVGEKRISLIREAWKGQKETRSVMIFLQDHGVSPAFAARIFKKYGQSAVEKVRQSPYRLARDIPGIGFLSADRIASSLGFEKDHPARVEAGLIHALQNAADEGHVFLPDKELLARAVQMLDVDRESVVQAMARLAESGRIVVETPDSGTGGPAPHGRAVFPVALHEAEKGAADQLKRLGQAPPAHREIDPDKAADWVQGRLGLRLAPLQIEAVRGAAREKVLVITGGPGTGKTTIIRAILAIFEKITEDIHLAAPTGRAAKRMSEAAGREARTIHRLLEYNPRRPGFERNSHKPLETDLCIVDEASMLDVWLTHQLLSALPEGAALILVGDVDQLPSVGPGQVLRDVIESGAVPVVRLTEVFRQAGQSSIITAAHLINSGRLPDLAPSSEGLEDFYFIERRDPAAAAEAVVELAARRIPERFGFDPFEDIQVISPMRRGEAGTANLNDILRQALNPEEQSLSRGDRRFYLGDKVMQVRNSYEREIFNGDIGRVRVVDRERGELIVDFDGRRVLYETSDLDELMPAYAVTVHKAQGSEYPAVILPLLNQHFVLLQRNLVYTAVTRGKRLVVVVGEKKAFFIAVNNDETRRRHTRLADRLKKG